MWWLEARIEMDSFPDWRILRGLMEFGTLRVVAVLKSVGCARKILVTANGMKDFSAMLRQGNLKTRKKVFEQESQSDDYRVLVG